MPLGRDVGGDGGAATVTPWNCGSVNADASAHGLSEEQRDEGGVEAFDGFEVVIDAVVDAALEVLVGAGLSSLGGDGAMLPAFDPAGRVGLWPSL